jgi:hypothetical protein
MGKVQGLRRSISMHPSLRLTPAAFQHPYRPTSELCHNINVSACLIVRRSARHLSIYDPPWELFLRPRCLLVLMFLGLSAKLTEPPNSRSLLPDSCTPCFKRSEELGIHDYRLSEHEKHSPLWLLNWASRTTLT